jgi:putative oxidoreductase
MNDLLNSFSGHALSLLRFITGFLFLWHGTQKLFAFPPSERAGGELSTMMLIGGILEFAGGMLVMIGLGTRWVAFVMSGLMAVAYFGWHAAGGFLPIVNRGELAVLYCFVFLYLWFVGGGSLSVDSMISKKSGS